MSNSARPHGMRADLIKAAQRAGLKLSDSEVGYRLQCAEAYATEAKVTSAAGDFGSWRALCDAGFPPVDGTDPDELEAAGLGFAPDEWEQLQLDIPGLKPTISVRGRQVRLVKDADGATVADIVAYRDMYRQMHENYGKTLDLIEDSLRTMRAGCGGDDTANAVQAWEAGIDHSDQ